MTTQHKVIIKDNLIYEVRAIEPDQAHFIAQANGLITPEAFTTKYNNHTLVLDHTGKIIRNQTEEVRKSKFHMGG